MTSVAGDIGYVYDAAERLDTLDDSMAGEFEYAYNTNNGLVATLDYPNGLKCEYHYDIMDRLEDIIYTLGGVPIESLGYDYHDATGMITNRTREGSLGESSTGYDYDTLDRLKVETLRDATGAVLDVSTYDYDLAGNRLEKARNDITVDYDPDTGNRLASWEISSTGTLETVVSVSGLSSETIGVDPRFGEKTINTLDAEAAGTNYWRISVPVSSGSVDIVAAIGDEAGNVSLVTNEITVTIITNGVYSYNSAGNLTNVLHNGGAVSNVLAWNEQYQLVSFSTNGGVAESYTYDVFGRRLTTTHGSNTMVHMYSGIHCIADTDTNGVPLRTYTYGPGVDNPLAMTTYSASETNTYYYLTDHLGSVLALTDDDGSVVETYDYDAWGRASVFDAGGTPLAESAYGNRITFQGREHSWATGLTYFRARWYDPVTGRWLSKDPIGISGGLNQYVAFGNSPVMYRDPSGLDIWYDYGGGNHFGLVIQDPDSPSGYTTYDFAAVEGGWDDWDFNVLYGPSKTTMLPFMDGEPGSGWVRIPTTPEQDATALRMAELAKEEGLPYSVIFNSCAHMGRLVLDASGIPVGNRLFDSPNRLHEDIQKYLNKMGNSEK